MDQPNLNEGDRVSLEYTAKLLDGTIVETSKSLGKPLECIFTGQQFLPGVFAAMTGMTEGETKIFELAPEEAYGVRNEDLVVQVPRSTFPESPPPEPGMVFIGETDQGARIPNFVIAVDDDFVVVDSNHPLAGQQVQFEIKILTITKTDS